MSDFIVKNRKYILVAIILLAAFLIFLRLDRADIQSDDATYSFRSIGYLDFMDSQKQTTPIQWFTNIPRWSKMSFHDAPPLVFLIQHAFFKVFGVSTFIARLPFALAGLGSIILLYFLANQLFNNKQIAILTSFIMTILSYHSWASRIGYLEPISLFFILLTLWLFLIGMKNPKKFVWFGIALGLTLLTKYTTFFIIPVIFLYILLKDKKIFSSKHFILSIIIAVLIFSPVVFYNFKLYQARGHFDLQFSILFNQDISKDWPVITRTEVKQNYLNGFINVWQSLKSSYSVPIYFLFFISLIWFVINFFWYRKKDSDLFLFLILIFLTVQFSLTGSSARYLSLFNPFVAIILAWGLVKSYQYFITKEDKFVAAKKIGFFILIIAIFTFELFYNLNTNIFCQPIGEAGKHYSGSRLENGGFQYLENYLFNEIDFNSLTLVLLKQKSDLAIEVSRDLVKKDLFIYDSNLVWFSSLWYFRRLGVYYRLPITSTGSLATSLPDINWFDHFKEIGARNMYYIHAESSALVAPNIAPQNKLAENKLAEIFEAMGAEITDINNINGHLAFKVYKLKLND